MAESGLTFQNAFELVQAAESAEKNATVIQRTDTVAVRKPQEGPPVIAVVVSTMERIVV